MSKGIRCLPLISAALLCGAWICSAPASSMGKSAAPTTQPFIATSAIHLRELLGDPPADDSAEQKAEIQTLLTWQEKRTPADVARCESEVASTPFTFSEVIGPWFADKNLPVTSALFHEISAETRTELNAAKKNWDRPRPFKADGRIHPCVVAESTPSYPSGHATRGIVWASVLAELFPQKHDAILAMGKRIGDDRVIAGMHYPSDVVAGQKLGAEIAKQMLASPEMAAALAKAKAECEKVAPANADK